MLNGELKDLLEKLERHTRFKKQIQQKEINRFRQQLDAEKEEIRKHKRLREIEFLDTNKCKECRYALRGPEEGN